ncbi:MAG: hypothetical protein ACD_4C00348G0001 [uncultured bacterium (gcode 4)]|uniref:Uncharacterized protein n=1 Tax=uncultured bacterium (gcode 4) TaxID=1234023 RepID=K2F5A0_9BACT|nr:MAG: hypothetical protein ACD_4C00348G0001 [uncultured bacterium (gcode 4)]
MFSASAFETFSLTLPPLSAIALASASPRPVKSLKTLITPILAAPAEVRTTLYVDFSSASSAHPAAAHITATGAAALTPNFSSIADTKSASSRIVRSETRSMIFCALALNFTSDIVL